MCEEICAGIVTYNPDCQRLKENINAVGKQVEKIFIYDNGSTNYHDICSLVKETTFDIVIHSEPDNKGIAAGLNKLLDLANSFSYTWILTLDQDSIVAENLIDVYKKHISIPNIGIICCELTDRNVHSQVNAGIGNNYRIVKKCITSGALTNVKLALSVGGFDEKLFIDSVDYDICYSLSENGYHTIKVDYIGLLHEVGKSTSVNIAGKIFAVNNHPAWRKYYISRNSTYMIKKHHLNPLIEYFYIYRRLFTVLFFEKEKTVKIKAILKGIHDGRRM